MKKLLLVFAAATVLGACKKDSEPAPTPTAATKADVLVAKNWRLSAQTTTYSIANTPSVSQDEYATYSSCERDNFLKFNANKTLLVDEGATKCDQSDPQTQNGSWDFNSDYSKLTLMDPSQGSVAIPFDVVELTATTMHLRYTIVTGTGATAATSVNDITFTSF